jgi:ABC-type phosphate transport system permease subunit
MHVRRTDGLVWQLAATALAKGVVGLIVDAVIISVGAGFFARPLAYVLAVAVAGNLVLRVYLRRRYPELLDVDD